METRRRDEAANLPRQASRQSACARPAPPPCPRGTGSARRTRAAAPARRCPARARVDVVVQHLPDASRDRLRRDPRDRAPGGHVVVAGLQIRRERVQPGIADFDRQRARRERVHDRQVRVRGLGGEVVEQRPDARRRPPSASPRPGPRRPPPLITQRLVQADLLCAQERVVLGRVHLVERLVRDVRAPARSQGSSAPRDPSRRRSRRSRRRSARAGF